MIAGVVQSAQSIKSSIFDPQTQTLNLMGNQNKYSVEVQTALQRRQLQISKHLPSLRQIADQLPPAKVQSLLRSDLPRLVKALNSREVSSQQLVAIFGLRAATLGKDMCIITEDYFEFALRRSEEYDKLRQSSGKSNWTLQDKTPYDPQKFLPPLFGIPTSLKDNIELQGTTSTVGLKARANRIEKQDGFLAEAIKRAGMIPFVKTNLPQMAMNFDTNNEVWGRALNPWNRNKSVGGSSGGEAAAVAGRMSPLGVGNDVAGSLRIPAAFCGVSSLLSGQYRLPNIGTCTHYSDGFSGMDLIKVVTGPISTSIDSLALWMATMTHPDTLGQNSDPYIKVQPFDVALYQQVASDKKPLRVGVLQNLEMVECTPGCRRGVNQVAAFLKKEGHEVFPIALPSERETIFSLYRDMAAEGDMASFKDMLEGEPVNKEYSNLETVTGLNCCLFGCVKAMAGLSQPRVQMLIEASSKLTAHEFVVFRGRAHTLRKQWIEYWRKQKLDYIICPGFGSQATTHGFSNDATILAAYTFIWNVLGMSVCTLPVTVTQESEQFYESQWADDITAAIKKTVADSAGLPINVQIVTLPHHEEKLLGLAKQVESHVQFYKNHPLPEL